MTEFNPSDRLHANEEDAPIDSMLPDDEELDRLVARASRQLETPPDRLTQRFERSVEQGSRPTWFAWTTVVASLAATIVAALLWMNQQRAGQPAEVPEGEMAHVQPNESVETLPRANLVNVSAPDGTILLPLESKNPNVTIFWVYRASNQPVTAEDPTTKQDLGERKRK